MVSIETLAPSFLILSSLFLQVTRTKNADEIEIRLDILVVFSRSLDTCR